MPPQTTLTVKAARQAILDAVSPVDGSESIPLPSALDRVLSRDVLAPIDVPAHDNSAMDGFALRFADLSKGPETRLKVIGTSFAGRPFNGTIGAGEAIRIMTGAVIPTGADAVVAQERVNVDGESISIPGRVVAGQKVGS